MFLVATTTAPHNLATAGRHGSADLKDVEVPNDNVGSCMLARINSTPGYVSYGTSSNPFLKPCMVRKNTWPTGSMIFIDPGWSLNRALPIPTKVLDSKEASFPKSSTRYPDREGLRCRTYSKLWIVQSRYSYL